MTETVRLARRVADMVPCSRREAEMLIEGGWVRVDGTVIEASQTRVSGETITIDPQARPQPVLPVTLLLHKPAGHDDSDGPRPASRLLLPGSRWEGEHHPQRQLQRHLQGQVCVTPLESGASGLLVFTQEWPLRRKLEQDAALVEHEVIVDVTGAVTPQALQQLNRAPVVDGRAMLPAKVSISRQVGDITGLRFALKGYHPGQVQQMCVPLGLTVVALRRIRIGRLALAALPMGQWRYRSPFERV